MDTNIVFCDDAVFHRFVRGDAGEVRDLIF